MHNRVSHSGVWLRRAQRGGAGRRRMGALFLAAQLFALPAVQFPFSARAQSAALEEIIVTAQKREQRANDVGIAITALSGAQIDALGAQNSTELIAYAPGVSLAGDIGGQRAIFNIRGVVQNDYADIAEAPVAVYVDGGYIASTQAQGFALYDVERVEILKGPQGTLFGRNATGGLVNTITKKPTEESTGYAEVSFARFNHYRLEGALGGAPAENTRGRFSFVLNRQGEIYRNVYSGLDAQGQPGTPGGGEDTYNDESFALRGQLALDLPAQGDLLFIANWADATKSEGPYQGVATTEVRRADGEAINVILSANDPLNCDIIQAGACIDGNNDGSAVRPVAGGSFWGDVDPDGDGRLVNKDFAFTDSNRIKSRGISAELNYELGAAQLTALSDYKKFTRRIGLDSDQTPRAALIVQSYGEIGQFSQELRLSGAGGDLNWVAGFYALLIDHDYTVGLAESLAGPDDFNLRGMEANTITELETNSYSAFGQLDYALNEQFTLVAGLRLTRENKDFDGLIAFFTNNDDRAIETNADALFSTDQLAAENNATLWSGKAQLEYAPDGGSLYYFGVNRGVKAGSFHAPLFNGLAPYDAEVLWSYEAGAKLTLMGGRAQLNTAVFYYDYNDYQSFSFRNNSSTLTNEDARSAGFESELLAHPVEQLTLQLGVSYLDAEVKGLQIAEDLFADTKPPFTPEWQLAALARTHWNVLGGTLAAQIQATWKSEFFYSASNFSAHEFRASLITGASLSWHDAEERWNASVFVKNLGDRRDPVIGFDVSAFYGTNQVSYTKPITFGLTLRRNF